MLRGDHQLSEAKFARWSGDARFRQARAIELFEVFGASAGSLGPKNMIAGANRDDYHLRNVTPGEDFVAEAQDLRQVVAGDVCTRCGGSIAVRNAIELARWEAPRAVRDLHVTNAAAQETPLPMSACKVWIDRILPAIALTCFDADGLVLPRAIAPFDVVVTPANYADPAQREAADTIYASCAELGLDALLDDRDERPGVKFKDADLIGIPYRITVGKKLSDGLVEIVDRKSKQTRTAAVGEAAAAVRTDATGGV
jgi:prolyl-tRNA synthetase